MLEKLLPARRLASIAAMTTFLPEPAELTLARQTLAKLTADRLTAQSFFEVVNHGHGQINLVGPDGSVVAEVTDGVIVSAFQRMQDLDAEVAEARKALNELLRSFAEKASQHVETGCKAVVEALQDRLSEIDDFLAILAELKLAARASGITLHQRVITNVDSIAANVSGIRRQLER